MMNRLISAFRWLCCAALLESALAGHVSIPLDSTEPQATIEIKSITPSAGSVVHRSTMIVAELEYSIRDFKPRTFFISVLFDATSPGTTRSARGSPYPREWGVGKSTGTVTVKQSLRQVWSDAALARPFKVWFYLQRREAGDSSLSVAEAGPIEFKDQ